MALNINKLLWFPDTILKMNKRYGSKDVLKEQLQELNRQDVFIRLVRAIQKD
jgi:hypothetical protein